MFMLQARRTTMLANGAAHGGAPHHGKLSKESARLVPARRTGRRILWIFAALALSTACADLLGIDNEMPSTEGLKQERVVVRGIQKLEGVPVREYVLDRVRYVEAGKPHSVDRVIRAQATLPSDELDALAVMVGDTLLATTRYVDINRVYSAPAPIPNGREDSGSYLIGLHAVITLKKE
jgi:hypothetical protein